MLLLMAISGAAVGFGLPKYLEWQFDQDLHAFNRSQGRTWPKHYITIPGWVWRTFYPHDTAAEQPAPEGSPAA